MPGEAAPAGGVTWDITLAIPRVYGPRGAERTTAGASARPLGPSAGGDAFGSALAGKRFLVIEDEPVVALEIRTTLEDAGAEIVGLAGTAEQAWHIMEHAAFDAALLDGNLHGRGVDDLAAALTRRSVPFAFVSGYGRESLPRAFANAAMVAKPFIPGELLDVARQLTSPRGDVIRFKP